MVKLYLVRHGETFLNKLRRMQGQIDSFLTLRGHVQAQQVGKSMQDINFTKIFSSDLGRAVQTTRDIIEELHLGDLPYITNSDIREVNFGSFDGLPCDDVWSMITRSTPYEDQNDIIKHGGMEEVRSLMLTKDENKYAESYREIIDRWKHFVYRLEPLSEADNVLIVSHGTFIRTISEYYGANVAGKDNVPLNGGVTIFNMNQSIVSLKKYNVLLK